MPQSHLVPTETTAPLALSYGSATLRGTATLLGSSRVLVELEGRDGASLSHDDAARCLAAAVRDGRCPVPFALAAAIERGAAVEAVLL